MNPALDELLGALRLKAVGDGRFVAGSVALGGMQAAFGGQLLAQMVLAADLTVPDKTVKSLQALFVAPARLDVPLHLEVEVMRSGRLYASTTVDVVQEGSLCARALVLLDRADEELAAHSAAGPVLSPPGESGTPALWGAAEMSVVGGVDLDDPDAVGPPELSVWIRFDGAPVDDGLSRGLLAYASEPHFFGTALRPHAGLSQRLAGSRLSPAVITHSVTYHGPVKPDDWMLFHVTSPHLGRGRIYGEASVFDRHGVLVASVNQQNQLRPVRRPAG